MKKLKPCPFCGVSILEEDIYCIDDGWGNCRYHGKEVWSVECPGCTAEGPWAKDKGQAAETWNKRKEI